MNDFVTILPALPSADNLTLIFSQYEANTNKNATIYLTSLFSDDPFEFSFKNVLLALFLISLGIVTVFGNIIVLLAIFVDFRLRQPTHYLMGSLALADLLLGKQRFVICFRKLKRKHVFLRSYNKFAV